MLSPSNCTALILAGGRGTRVAGLYPDLPKPLIPAAGKPFLHWVVLWLGVQGFNKIILSTGHLAEMVTAWSRAFSDDHADQEVDLVCCKEDVPLGTAGGIINCLEQCGDWIVVLNGDSLVMSDLQPLLNLVAENNADGGLIGVEVPDASRFGTLIVDSTNQLRGFAEKRPGTGLINSGVYVFRKAALEHLPKRVFLSLELDVIPALLESTMRLMVHNGGKSDFLDIGTPETVELAGDFIRRNPNFFLR